MVVHPALVHYPLAFYFLELVLILFWQARKDPAFLRFAHFSFRMGYLFMIAAIIAGYFDAGAHLPVPVKIRLHFYAAASVLVFYTLRAVYWHWAKEDQKNYPAILLIGTLIGNALLTLTGFLGGKIVYG